MNLFLALTNYGKSVAFTTVWEKGHTEAERSGDAEDNFISWIAQIEGVSDNDSGSTTSSSTNALILFLILLLILLLINN